MWPEYRSGEYALWNACRRLGILPPGVQPKWEDNGVQMQAMILAYDQTCSHDETERDAQLAGARMPQV